MKPKTTTLLGAIFLGLLAISSLALAETSATGAGAGVYPPDTTFSGVPISGVQFGFGVEIADGGSSLGHLCIVLLGVAVGDVQQQIKIETLAATGSRNGPNIAVVSGTSSVDMGDGTPPTPGVPVTVTITTNVSNEGSIGLVIGSTTLPDAVVNVGSMTIKTP